MKQVVIDYSEYLELEKAKKQVDMIKKELNEGALVTEQQMNDSPYQDPMYLHVPKFRTKIILTAGLQTILEEIGGANAKSNL